MPESSGQYRADGNLSTTSPRTRGQCVPVRWAGRTSSRVGGSLGRCGVLHGQRYAPLPPVSWLANTTRSERLLIPAFLRMLRT